MTTPVINSTTDSKNISLAPKDRKFRTYRLFYHFRAAAPLDLVFEHEGTFHEAIDRAKLHCQKMNYRFIKVRPFIVDLDEREKRVNDGVEDF
jgi:hypothetical protein